MSGSGPADRVRSLTARLGMHPHDPQARSFSLDGTRALVIATNHSVLRPGKRTGVFCSEFSVPYYLFSDAGMAVELASPAGGVIPVDPQSLRPALRCVADDRLVADAALRAAMSISAPVGDLDGADYDIVYLAGGWGAAFDFAACEPLGRLVMQAVLAGAVVGGVCHGPLGLCTARYDDGTPLVSGRRLTCVTDKQIAELRITDTPYHPETEMRRLGATFECSHRFRDPLANHWVVDGRLVTGQNQNAGPMVAREMMQLVESSQRVPLADAATTGGGR